MGEVTTQQNDVPYLDISATYKDGEVILCVINRHKDKAIATDFISQTGMFNGDFEVYEVNGPDTKADNDFGKTQVETKQKPVIKVNKSDQFSYLFPAHSFTLIKGKIVE